MIYFIFSTVGVTCKKSNGMTSDLVLLVASPEQLAELKSNLFDVGNGIFVLDVLVSHKLGMHLGHEAPADIYDD